MRLLIIILFAFAFMHSLRAQENVDEYFNRMQHLGFSGSVLVAKNGKVILNKGFGLADRITKSKVTSNSIFSTGSVTKQFTAAAIMKLEDQGLLQTEERISEYLKNVPEDKSEVTVHHLLTHTAGFSLAFSDNDFTPIDKDEYYQKSMKAQLLFPPGERFSYSNIGYSLLAMIVENISGISYEEFLKENLFVPAGMNTTGYALPIWDEGNFVHIYKGAEDNGTTVKFTEPTWHLYGNGGILSTTHDMFLWTQALKSGKILSERSLNKMFTPYANNYGYGWDVLDGGALRQHNGGSYLGCGAEIRWFVEDEIFTMIFSNATMDGDQGFSVVRNDLEALIFNEEINMPPKVKNDNLKVLSIEQGQYKTQTGSLFTIEKVGEVLEIAFDNQEILDFLFQPEAYEKGEGYSAFNGKFSEALKNVSKNDFSGFEFIGAAKDLKFEIQNEIKLADIEKPVFKVYKSVPAQNPKGGIITTIAINDGEFEGLSLLMDVVTLNEKYLGVGVNFGEIRPISMKILPESHKQFILYNIRSNLQTLIEIHKTKSGLILVNNQVKLEATKYD